MKKLVLALAFVFLISMASAGTDGNVARWNFNEGTGTTAADSVASYDLTVEDNWDATGISGSALIASATSTDIGMSFSGNASITINTWVYRTGDPSADGASDAVFSTRENAAVADGEFYISMFNSTSARFQVYNPGTQNAACGEATLNTWVMFTAVYNSTTAICYRNGVQYSYVEAAWTPSAETIHFLSNTNGGDSQNFQVDESRIWQRALTGNDILSLFGSTTLNTPTDNSASQSDPVVFNVTSSSVDGTLQNVTLFVYDSDSSIVNQSTKTITGFTNSTTHSIANIVIGAYTWNALTCSTTTCSYSGANFTFTKGAITIAESYSSTATETERETFSHNISLPAGTTISSVKLLWNGTNKGGAATLIAGNNYSLSTSFDIPTQSFDDSVSFNWNVTYSTGFQQALASDTQTISQAILALCDGTYTVPYINFTFKNETIDQEDVNSKISESNFTYWIGSGTVKNGLTFSESGENASYAFCFSPPHETINADITLSYLNSESQQRTYQPDTLTLTNTTTNQALFLLPTSDGIFVTFQVINLAEQPINGAILTLSRSGFGQVAQTTTGSSGTATIFLNPNFVYTLLVEASGFSDLTVSQSFPTTEFTITMGLSGQVGDDFIRGISYDVEPNSQSLLNSTTYGFNYTISSSYWNLESWGFVIKNSTGDTLATNTSTTSAGGFLSTELNTGNNTLFTMEYYWAINGSYNNRTISWAIRDAQEGSIKGFFDKLKTYTSQGIFGLTPFGVAIILFVMIFFFAGVLSFKFGITSPLVIFGAATLFVILFDIINILPNPTGVRFLPSVIMVILTLIIILGGRR